MTHFFAVILCFYVTVTVTAQTLSDQSRGRLLGQYEWTGISVYRATEILIANEKQVESLEAEGFECARATARQYRCQREAAPELKPSTQAALVQQHSEVVISVDAPSGDEFENVNEPGFRELISPASYRVWTASVLTASGDQIIYRELEHWTKAVFQSNFEFLVTSQNQMERVILVTEHKSSSHWVSFIVKIHFALTPG